MGWLDKLREAKALIEELKDTGADLMRKVSLAMKKIADAITESADLIDPTLPAAAGAVDWDAVLAFKAECEKPRAQAFPWQELLTQLIIIAIEELLKRRKPA